MQASREGRGAAAGRAHAELDRDSALGDRQAAASGRGHAELDREAAMSDRAAGTGERAHAELDREEALADRAASARAQDHATVDWRTRVDSCRCRARGTRARDRQGERSGATARAGVRRHRPPGRHQRVSRSWRRCPAARQGREHVARRVALMRPASFAMGTPSSSVYCRVWTRPMRRNSSGSSTGPWQMPPSTGRSWSGSRSCGQTSRPMILSPGRRMHSSKNTDSSPKPELRPPVIWVT